MKNFNQFVSEEHASLKVGDWISQDNTGTYGVVVEINPSGKIKAITARNVGKAKSQWGIQNWNPYPKVWSNPEKDFPARIYNKIKIKAGK